MKLVLHSLLIAIAFAFVFVWEQTPLDDYTIQALGIFVFLYLINTFIRKKRNPSAETFGSTLDIFILITVILLLISITGNLYSPLFFLLYFLGFGITFIFEPFTVFIFVVGCIGLFLPQVLKNTSIESFIRIGSIALISPLAYFFGEERRDYDESQQEKEAMQERVADAANTISQDVEGVLKKQKTVLKDEAIEKLNEILEESENLREEGKKTKS